MGVWRRLKEKIRECRCFPGAHREPTSNARNEAMMKAATVFSQQLKTCAASIRTAHSANLDLLTSTQTTMALSLPQTYEESNQGAGSVTATLNLVGGPACDVGSVSRLGNEMGHQLETEVLAPLARWQEVRLQLLARSKELKNVRLEMDARRRALAQVSVKVNLMRAKVGAGSAGTISDQKLDKMIHAMSHKEAQLKVATGNFDQQEAQLACDLAALITDGQYLKHYIAAALRLEGGALLGVANAFGELASPATPAAPPSPSGTPTRTATLTASPVSSVGIGAPSAAASSEPPIGAACIAVPEAPETPDPCVLSGTLASGSPAADNLATDHPFSGAVATTA